MALEILVSEHIVIDVLRKELFEDIIDFKKLPEFFDFILRVEELDDLSYTSVGKKYLEFVKGSFFNTRPVLSELLNIKKYAESVNNQNTAYAAIYGLNELNEK